MPFHDYDERLCLAEGFYLVHCAYQSTLAKQGLARHVESAALLHVAWRMMVVHSVRTLRSVTSEILFHLAGQFSTGDGFVDRVHIFMLVQGFRDAEIYQRLTISQLVLYL